MDAIHEISDSSPASFPRCAVAIGVVDDGWLHVGILHTRDLQPTEFLHLASHCDLRNSPSPPSYLKLWAKPNIPDRRMRAVVAKCGQIARASSQNSVPYGFSSPEGALDPATGAFLISGSRYGLTCASFVLAVYDAVGVRLAEYSTWPADRAGDRDWQADVVRRLEEAGACEPSHLARLKVDVGAVRYRPEEVVAATALAKPTCAFDAAASLGAEVRVRLTSGGSRSSP